MPHVGTTHVLWSDIAVVFVTNQTYLQWYYTILVIIDHFSKACHLIPLKGLPTAMETAEALFHQVFKPEDIVSDFGLHHGMEHLLQLP